MNQEKYNRAAVFVESAAGQAFFNKVFWAYKAQGDSDDEAGRKAARDTVNEAQKC